MIQVPPTAKVLIASPHKTLQGLLGLMHPRSSLPLARDVKQEDSQNQHVQTWLQTATLQWMNKNKHLNKEQELQYLQ